MTTGETWAAARLKPAAPGPPPLPQPSGLPRWGTGWKAGVQPTPKAARAPPPTPIPGRRHVSSPAPPFRAPSFTATRGSTAARKPAEAVGAGQCWGAFVSEKAASARAAGGGAWTLTHRPLPSLGSPGPADTAPGNNGNGREGKRARHTKAPRAPPPGVSSFLQVVLLGPLTPSKEAQARLAPWGSRMGPGTPPSTLCGLAFSWAPQRTRNLPPTRPCTPGSPPAAS